MLPELTKPEAPPAPVDGQIHELGSELVGWIYSALRTLQVHDHTNEALANATAKVTSMLSAVGREDGSVALVFLEDDVYLNSVRIRVPRHLLPRYVGLVRQLKRVGLVRFDVAGKPEDLDVRRALELIARPTPGLQRETFGSVTLEFTRGAATGLPGHLIDRQQYALRVYAKAILFLREFAQAIHGPTPPPVRKAYRLVQDLVDIARDDVLPLLGLSAIRDHKDQIFHHSVNVTILAVALGQRLKMPRHALAELGMAALLHDLGKLSIPLEVINKTGQLTDAERKMLGQIPRETVRVMMRHDSLCRGHPLQLVLAYELHLLRSVKDYVRVFGKQSVFYQTQILAISNYYDALTTARPNRGPYLPDQALQLVMAQVGEKFDPAVARAFANLIGRYPIGTLAVLDDGCMGVVVHTVAEEPHRPMLKVVLDAAGTRIDGPYLDLAAEGEKRRIVECVNPHEYKINVLKYLINTS